jgi:NAD(P)-dependent dehydrogenase (short-subunit alcohol dehydrogenase family)
MMRFGGKVAVVTGAASGIGLATAEMLAAEGAFVIGTDRHDAGEAWTPAAQGRGLFLRHDVCEALDWRHVMQTALGRYGRLDVLVNAAGINGVFAEGTPPQQVQDMDDAVWALVTRINAEGVMLGCRFALQAMSARGGAIVNISSIAAKKAWTLRAAYGVSKASVFQHTKSVARLAGLRARPATRSRMCRWPVWARRRRWRRRSSFLPATRRPTSPAPACISTAASPRHDARAGRRGSAVAKQPRQPH